MYHLAVAASTLLTTLAQAQVTTPFEISTKGILEVDFDAMTFTLESDLTIPSTDIDINKETAWGVMTRTDDGFSNHGEITFSGLAGTAVARYTGFIAINDDGTFALGIGDFDFIRGSGTLRNIAQRQLFGDFWSNCGTFNDPNHPGRSVYNNGYTVVPAGSVVSVMGLGILATAQRRR